LSRAEPQRFGAYGFGGAFFGTSGAEDVGLMLFFPLTAIEGPLIGRDVVAIESRSRGDSLDDARTTGSTASGDAEGA
jgi:hypothetical protein